MSTKPNTLDRFRGCLLGLAIGDALGAPVEFKHRLEFKPITGYRAGGTWNLPAGYWTDDTSMALCLADSLIEKQCFDPRDQMEKYLRWRSTGYNSSTGKCFDIGATTARALSAYFIQPPDKKDPYCGSTARNSAGNGSIMRLAPVPMAYAFFPDDHVVYFCEQSSKTTHAAEEPVDGCRWLGWALASLLKGVPSHFVLSNGWESVSNVDAELTDLIFEIAKGSPLHEWEYDGLPNSGYVVHTLLSAVWCFAHSKSFEDAVLKAVNLGGDSDTIGAVTGQLAGAYYGLSGIPPELVTGLYNYETIIYRADQLFEFACSAGSAEKDVL